MVRLARGVMVVAAVACAGCADLPVIASGTCGNALVEPDTEDCDTFAPSGQTCGAPGTAEACRFTCDRATLAGCPDGWGCGAADGICRVPASAFAGQTRYHVPAEGFVVGDVDGDGHPDLVGYSSDTVEALFGDGTGSFPQSFTTSTLLRKGPIAAGFLDASTGSKTLDVAVPLATGVFVLLGSEGRALAPVAYAPFPTPPGMSYGIMPMEVASYDPNGVGNLGHESLTLVARAMTFDINNANAFVLLPGNHDTGELEGRVAVGDLNKDGKDEFALAFLGDPSVYVYGVQAISPQLIKPLARPTIALGGGAKVRAGGARLVDLNGDGWLDLMVSVELSGNVHAVQVAYNDGAGNLVGPAATAPLFDQLLTVRNGLACSSAERWPLAVGVLHKDVSNKPWADFVGDRGVCVSDGANLTQVYYNLGAPWVDAVVSDFNRDGARDVAATSDGETGVTFLLGTNTGAFNFYRTVTDDPPTMLRVGDFDGDLVPDLAAVMRGDLAGRQQYLGVLFGNLQGAPSSPVFQGNLGAAPLWVEPLYAGHDFFFFDAIADLVIGTVSTDLTTKAVALLQGSSSRAMFAPYALDNVAPLATVIAELDGDGVPDVLGVTTAGLYLLKGDGQGGLARTAGSPFAFPDGISFQPACALYESGRLLGGASDVLVGIDGAATRSCASDATQTPYAGPPRVVIGRPGMTFTPVQVESRLRTPRELRIADVDADGAPDLIVVYANAGTKADPADVIVYWNHGGAFTFDGTQSSLIPTPPITGCATCRGNAFSVAALDLDGKKGLELAVLSDAGVFRVDFDAAHGAHVVAAPLILPMLRFETGSLYAADVNGDGVTDLVLNQPPFVRAFLGRATRP